MDEMLVMTPEEFLRTYPPKERKRKPSMEDIFSDVFLALHMGVSVGYWHNAYELSRITKHTWSTVKKCLRIMRDIGVVEEKIMPLNEMQNKRGYRLRNL